MWLKSDTAEDKSLVQFYVVSGEWFMMIRRTLVSQYPVSISKDDITVILWHAANNRVSW